MFTYNLDPVLLKLGMFEIRYYGLVYALGFLLVYFILNFNREKFKLDREDIEKYLFHLILGAVIGARSFHVLFSDFNFYSNNLIEILKFWRGGMAFHGGLIGVVLVSYIFCRKKEINFLKLADLIVIPTVFILALGRVANFINGELWGTVTNVSWCVNFNNLCRHPTQIYEALSRFFIFGVLLLLNTKKWKRGFLFWIFILLMGVGRFSISFLRVDDKVLSLSMGQYFSLIMIVISGYVLIKDYLR